MPTRLGYGFAAFLVIHPPDLAGERLPHTLDPISNEDR